MSFDALQNVLAVWPDVIVYAGSLLIAGFTAGISYAKLDKRIALLENSISDLKDIFNANHNKNR